MGEMSVRDVEQIEWVQVDSSNLAALAYDHGVIYAMFKGGEVYRYAPKDPVATDVLDDFVDWLDADSHGRYLHRGIMPFYSWEKVYG